MALLSAKATSNDPSSSSIPVSQTAATARDAKAQIFRSRRGIVADDVATAYAQSASDASDDIGDARAISRSNDCT